jgi:hypothetical protein
MNRIAPLEIIVGKTYKNFKGHWRKVISVDERSTEVSVTYEDGTGTSRTCKIGSFRQWVKKQYY